MAPKEERRFAIRVAGIFVILVSLIYGVMLSIGSGSSLLISVLSWAALFSIVSGIGILFLKNWARIYSAVFLVVATIVFLLEHLSDSTFRFTPMLLIALGFSLAPLALATTLLSPKVAEQFRKPKN